MERSEGADRSNATSDRSEVKPNYPRDLEKKAVKDGKAQYCARSEREALNLSPEPCIQTCTPSERSVSSLANRHKSRTRVVLKVMRSIIMP